MRKLEGLEPYKVFHFFEEICNIPHGSYDIDRISDYLYQFAKARNLDCIQDEYKNVIINAPATEGYENEPAVIIQGHMDMVAVKDADSDIDLSQDGLRLCHDADYIWAEGTSLGGDDGIAVAYALAILDSPEIVHPKLQVILTVNEEVGMDGAIGISSEIIYGKRMLNIDSEEEGIFTVGCAGGTKLVSKLPINYVIDDSVQDGLSLNLSVEGLQGGHSGTMIHLGRCNANIILARWIYELSEKLKSFDLSLSLCNINGGEKSNAIPAYSNAEVCIISHNENIIDNDECLKRVKDITEEFERVLKSEYSGKDDDLRLNIANTEKVPYMDEISTNKCIQILLMQPDGVQNRNAYMTELVETSLNLGIMKTTRGVADYFETTYELRSSVKSSMSALKNKVMLIAKMMGCELQILGEYPEWEFRKDSLLQKKMVEVYEKMYGGKPVIDIIHAGLECGVFSEKIAGLDAVSFGPNILDIHTTKEKLDIASTKRVWEYLLELLATKEN